MYTQGATPKKQKRRKEKNARYKEKQPQKHRACFEYRIFFDILLDAFVPAIVSVTSAVTAAWTSHHYMPTSGRSSINT